MKLCGCGCGRPTRLATKTDSSTNRVKGQPMRYVNGHGHSRPLWERFRDKVDFRPGDCWLWTASTGSHGYGQIEEGGTMRLAHVVSYEFFVGPIPPGKELHHLCENEPCVHPLHLEPITRREHMERHRG